jgi:hypothetical protein
MSIPHWLLPSLIIAWAVFSVWLMSRDGGDE